MVKECNLSVSTDGLVIRCSESIEEMLGFSLAELSGRKFVSLSPKDLRGEHALLLEPAKGGVPISGYKTRLLRKDGKAVSVYVSVYPLRDRSGALYAFMLILSTAKSQAVPPILTEEFQRIFRFSNDAVTVTDRAGNIIDVNQAFLDTYGYSREDVLGRNSRILKSPHSTKALYGRMWKDILDPDMGWWQGEIINLARDGKEVPVFLSINAIKDRSGEIKNFLGIAFNLTRQKELEKVNRMYIDHIVHDMRGPLTSIITNSEILLLLSGETLSDKGKKRIESVIASSLKLNNMASDMLDFSRAQNGILALKKENVSLMKAFKEAAMPFEHSEKKLFVNGAPYLEGHCADMEVVADSDKLQRIIYNLLSNAFKHAFGEITVRYENLSGDLCFRVSNDGRAINAEEAGRIFDAFYQTPDGIKAGGAGLGLSIVKCFVEAHGGRVWVEPSENGATFAFSIPIAADKP